MQDDEISKILSYILKKENSKLVRKTHNREVYRVGLGQNNVYYVKVFYQPVNPLKYLIGLINVYYEYRHHLFLLKKGAPLPELLGIRFLKYNEIIIITNEVKNSVVLSDLAFQTLLGNQLLNGLMAFLVNCYKSGFYHNDLHLGNILYVKNKNEFIFVDPKKLKHKRNLSLKNIICNFTSLYCYFYKLPDFNDCFWQNLLSRFFISYGIEHDSGKWNVFANKIVHKKLASWVMARLKRAFRNNADYNVFSDKGGYGIYSNYLTHFFKSNNIFSFLHNVFTKGNNYYKNSNTTAVIKINIFDDEFVIKKFKVKRWFAPIKNVFRKSRAYKSWKWAVVCLLIKIPVPEPVFFFEKRRYGLLFENYYCARFNKNTSTLAEYLNNNQVFDKKLLLKFFAGFLIKLNKSGITHTDFQLKNILIEHDELSYLFYLIDLECVTKSYIEKRAVWRHLYHLRKSYLRLNDTGVFSNKEILWFLKSVLGGKYWNRQKVLNLIRKN